MIIRIIKKIKEIWCNIILVVPEGFDPPRIFHLLSNQSSSKKLTLAKKKSNNIFNGNRYIYCVQIKFLESLADEVYIKSAVSKMGNSKASSILLIDLSAEAITFNGYTASILHQFHKILSKIGDFNYKNIYLLNANSKSEEAYKFWLSESNFDGIKINMIGYDFYLYEYYSELNKSNWFKNYAFNKLLDIANSTNINSPLRNKSFSTFNLRPREHRWALILYLRSKNLISNGLITFFGEDFGSIDSPSVSGSREIREFLLKVEDRPGELLQHYEEILHLTPITSDRTPSEMRSDLWGRKEGEIQFLIPEANRDGNINAIESYYEIVTETWLTNKNCLYFTEKTLRAILRMQIFIIIGTPHTIRHLKNLGFRSFSPYINESYDEIEEPILRLRAIFLEIDRLEKMSKIDLHKLYVHLIPIFIHNLNHLLVETPNILSKEITNMKILN